MTTVDDIIDEALARQDAMSYEFDNVIRQAQAIAHGFEVGNEERKAIAVEIAAICVKPKVGITNVRFHWDFTNAPFNEELKKDFTERARFQLGKRFFDLDVGENWIEIELGVWGNLKKMRGKC